MSLWNSLTYLDYVVIGVVLLIILYVASTWNYDYFAKRGIPFRKPVLFFGNLILNILKLQSVADFVKDCYDAFPEHQVSGVFVFQSPTLLLRDPEILKAVTVKDFDHFMDHFKFMPDGVEPLVSANLFTLKGQRWRHMRALLSPAFTSSKMKGMFHLISQCGQQLVDHLESKIKESDRDMIEVDMKDLFTRFTNDVIATSAFGISCDSLKEPNNEFYKCGKDISYFGRLRSLIFLGYFACPKLMQILKIGLFTKSSREFLYKTITESIATRKKNGIIRPDMIHLLMQARKGELKDDDETSKETSKAKNQKYELTDTDITAQAMIFFLAGFETASVLLGFASLLLAINPDVQERLQQEIDQTLDDCKGKITYDALHRMKYLDMVVSETLRLYPPSVAMDRECVKPYTIPATKNTPEIHLKPKDPIFIPTFGFHRDPLYFPDPEKFDPERFSDENKHNIKPFTYMPFGLGPRACIGSRFTLMEDKIALTYLLSRFSLHVTPKSSVPIKLSADSFHMIPDKGFWIGLKKRQFQ